jgi:hypothetical protein
VDLFLQQLESVG